MGYDMIDSFTNPIQCEDNYVRVDLRPKLYYPNKNNSHSIPFPDVDSIVVEYNSVIPGIVVCRPTKYKVENCEQIFLTSKFDWDPYVKGGSFSKVEDNLNGIE